MLVVKKIRFISFGIDDDTPHWHIIDAGVQSATRNCNLQPWLHHEYAVVSTTYYVGRYETPHKGSGQGHNAC